MLGALATRAVARGEGRNGWECTAAAHVRSCLLAPRKLGGRRERRYLRASHTHTASRSGTATTTTARCRTCRPPHIPPPPPLPPHPHAHAQPHADARSRPRAQAHGHARARPLGGMHPTRTQTPMRTQACMHDGAVVRRLHRRQFGGGPTRCGWPQKRPPAGGWHLPPRRPSLVASDRKYFDWKSMRPGRQGLLRGWKEGSVVVAPGKDGGTGCHRSAAERRGVAGRSRRGSTRCGLGARVSWVARAALCAQQKHATPT